MVFCWPSNSLSVNYKVYKGFPETFEVKYEKPSDVHI